VNRLLVVVLAALVVALACAARFGGALGGGVLAGYLLGAGLAGLSVLYQMHLLATRPERAMTASVLGFLVLLVALFFGGLSFRYLEPVAERADWRSFLVSFAVAGVLVLPLGTHEALRNHRRRGGLR
jgi:MFS family permease